MEEHAEDLGSEITKHLEKATGPGSPNQVSADKVRTWAREYLDDYDDELQQFPELAGQPHWNLWMVDKRMEDAVFVVLVFRTDHRVRPF